MLRCLLLLALATAIFSYSADRPQMKDELAEPTEAEMSTLIKNMTMLRKRRLHALWNFEKVTECRLHYSALVYNNYGCWCGVGGDHEPVDGIDDCCRTHDHCYDEAVNTKKCFDVEWEYLDPYQWTCDESVPLCGTKPPNSECGEALCACDAAVTACWAKYPKPESKKKCNWSKMRKPSKFFEV